MGIEERQRLGIRRRAGAGIAGGGLLGAVIPGAAAPGVFV